ncbi:dihydroxyacetone kinase subunit DhaL [Pseudomonas sp. dw_358]|uniref:dihydroxyacetone kinase subunit DhaL n=1 Tax=Pseudomonas sp. dw_358 TaxID=2720083 RepID=UPI001BD67E46|nr:dihydroxyacetone kinase subunit DhaL [Pseudomonas sp. dw_358]
MKKLINDALTVVDDMLEGVALANRDLILLQGENIVARRDFAALGAAGKVVLISGGGAGHEPAHAGYVGQGLLTAAVVGAVFTSPSVDAVLSAIMTLTGPAGVLLIVKNYTGDRLNFGLAAELARSAGVAVEMIVVGDDVALDDNGTVGRRGIAGTVLVHKVAGAAAEAGLPLAEVKAAAERAATGLFSMGLGLSACTVPAAGTPGFTLGDNEVEYGLGIHGENGVRRGPVEPADNMVHVLLERIFSQGQLLPGERVVAMINNLGGTAVQELDIVARHVLAGCVTHGLKVEAVLVGTFLTALEMAGCSVTLLRVDDATLARLRAPTCATAWHPLQSPATDLSRQPCAALPVSAGPSGASWRKAATFKAALVAVCAILKEHESHLTELDSVVGDGDLGTSLARGAVAIERALDTLDCDHPALALQQISAVLRRSLGGTSGPLYAIFTFSAGASLAGAEVTQLASWSRAFQAGCEGVMKLGGAKAGERTMLDALLPAAHALRNREKGAGAGECALLAASAALQGAAQTKQMLPRKGRSSYLGERALGHVDPGAFAVGLWMMTVANALNRF